MTLDKQDLITVILPIRKRQSDTGAIINSIIRQETDSIIKIMVGLSPQINDRVPFNRYLRAYPDQVQLLNSDTHNLLDLKNKCIEAAKSAWPKQDWFLIANDSTVFEVKVIDRALNLAKGCLLDSNQTNRSNEMILQIDTDHRYDEKILFARASTFDHRKFTRTIN